MVDVRNHSLVPEHDLLSAAEIEDVLEEYDIKRTDLPKIDLSDPALPEGAAPGDVVRIERDSRTTERAVVYRLVIE